MIYQTLDYRKATLSLIERHRQTEPRLTFARIAAAAKIQPTYFSNVLKGRAHFSSDQLYLICQTIQAKTEEIEYLLNLLEWTRSTVTARKNELRARIDGIRQINLQTHKHLKTKPVTTENLSDAEYYLDPSVQLVHVYLGIPRYAKNPSKLAEELGIAPEKLQTVIRLLEKLGAVAVDSRGQYHCLTKNRHLPQTSPLCLPHQILMRLKSAEQLNRLPEQNRHHVSVTFSTDRERLDQIRVDFLEFLKRTETLVAGGPEEIVCQLNFDLFPWSLTTR